MSNTITTYLTTQEAMFGYMVVQCWETRDEDGNQVDFDMERVKDSMFQYQFLTKKEAIADFEAWAGDNWDIYEEQTLPNGNLHFVKTGEVEKRWS